MKALVIAVNRFQPAYLGCYGNDWLATPTFDRLAAESVVFDQHFADQPSPRGARAAWHTGRYAFAPPVLPSHMGLARLLWEHGTTAAIIGDERSASIHSRFGSGWQAQQWIRRGQLTALEQDSLLGGTVQTAAEWLDGQRSQDSWLLWLEIDALQPPWEPTAHDAEGVEGLEEETLEPWFDPPFGRVGAEIAPEQEDRLSATYAGMVSGVDQWLGQLFDFLKEKGAYDDLLVILTSDCGLALGEHGLFGPVRPWLHEELTHLPLLIRLPGGAEAGRRIHQLTQPIDLAATLAEAFGIPVPELFHGQSLLPIARGGPQKLREYSCSALARANDEEWAIRTHHWYYLLPLRSSETPPRQPQLYVKPDDRWEVNNVLTQHVEVAEHLELTLRRFMAAAALDRVAERPELRKGVTG